MIYKSLIVIFIAAILVFLIFSNQGFSTPPIYTTWDGLEPDKWASIWLIKKQISPDSKIDIRPMHSRTDDGIAFDIPGSKFYRNPERSTYASLLDDYRNRRSDVHDPVLTKMGDIIQDMDVNVWADKVLLETTKIENAIRTLQQDYNRSSVPSECDIALFDDVYMSLSNEREVTGSELNKIVRECGSLRLNKSIARNTSTVAEIPVNEVMRQIDMGKNVVFVDTREREEYEEMHIPGALNIKLRDVNQNIVSQLKGADLIISYCVKDFRGYEVARAIGELGVENSSIMTPYGIRGWNDLGLPVFSQDGFK